MTNKFYNRVMSEGVVDTREYRYMIDERGSDCKTEN